MNARTLRLALAAALALSLAAIPLIGSRALERGSPSRATERAISPPEADTVSPVTDSLLRGVIARTPFRARRAPAGVAYDPERGRESGAPPPSRPPRPTLVLSGIVWEEEPAAVIEGLPGADGPRVVRRDDVVGGLRVRRIGRQQVVITGDDTTWTLRVREPWQ